MDGSTSRRAFALAALACSAACVRTAPVPRPGYWLGSDSTLTSPTVRFRVAAVPRRDDIEIIVDSAELVVPGEHTIHSPPIMGRLRVRALLATADSSPITLVTGGRNAARRQWRVLASSDSVLVADELVFGERRSVAPFRLRVTGAPRRTDSALWIVLRVTGDAVELRPPAGPGATPVRQWRPGAVLVHACGPFSLEGGLDPGRNAALERAHGVAC